jgi:hypothetical protein
MGGTEVNSETPQLGSSRLAQDEKLHAESHAYGV